MYRPPDSVLEHRLTRVFPAARLRELARTTGLVERRRKLDAAALFWALTLGFAVGEDRSLETLRQSYLRCVGGELSLTYASFHGWFAASLTTFLREVLDCALDDLSDSTDHLDGRLKRFRDVLIPDTTVITVYRSLIDAYPGSGEDHAGATLLAVSLLGVAMDLGWVFAAAVLLFGGVFLWAIVVLFRNGTKRAAFRAFMVSNVFLGGVLGATVLDVLLS